MTEKAKINQQTGVYYHSGISFIHRDNTIEHELAVQEITETFVKHSFFYVTNNSKAEWFDYGKIGGRVTYVLSNEEDDFCDIEWIPTSYEILKTKYNLDIIPASAEKVEDIHPALILDKIDYEEKFPVILYEKTEEDENILRVTVFKQEWIGKFLYQLDNNKAKYISGEYESDVEDEEGNHYPYDYTHIFECYTSRMKFTSIDELKQLFNISIEDEVNYEPNFDEVSENEND